MKFTMSIDSLGEPFRYFSGAIAVATIAGALCALVGVYVVLRGMSYIGHGLSHAIFGWAVLSFAGNVNFYVGAGAGGFISALMINGVARRRIVGADAAIGVVTTGAFALGIALVSRLGSFTRNFEAALFGNVLGVTDTDLLVVAGVALAVSATVFFRYRSLLFSTFDPEVANIVGRPVRSTDTLLSFLLAATVVATMQVLGVTLIAAALVAPPATARMLTHRFSRMMWISVAIGAVCGFFGVYFSYFLDIASGAAVVLTNSVIFICVFAITSDRARKRSPSNRRGDRERQGADSIQP